MHVDLLEDHLPLAVQVRRSGVLEHVREVVDGQLEVLVEDPRVVARVLLRRTRSGRRRRRRTPPRCRERTASRALEQQVLEEVARPADRRRLVPRAGQDPEGDTERTPGIRSVTTRRPEENSVRSMPTDRLRPSSLATRRALLGVPEAPAVTPRAAVAVAVPRLARLARLRSPSPSRRPLAGRLPLGADRAQADLALRVDVLDEHGQAPSFTASSTEFRRLPLPSLEMWTRPSRPGTRFTKAPNVVVFTTVPS